MLYIYLLVVGKGRIPVHQSTSDILRVPIKVWRINRLQAMPARVSKSTTAYYKLQLQIDIEADRFWEYQLNYPQIVNTI